MVSIQSRELPKWEIRLTSVLEAAIVVELFQPNRYPKRQGGVCYSRMISAVINGSDELSYHRMLRDIPAAILKRVILDTAGQ